MTKYEEAFFLRDNPFCPAKPLAGISSPLLMSNLSTQPLRIHMDEALMSLYCADVGKANLDQFRESVSHDGYDPPGIGSTPFLSLILGPQGTGKTTLANAMVHHLKQCAPNAPGKWRVYDPWADREFDQSEQQVETMARLQAQVLNETTDKDYLCVLLDNLKSGAEQAAFNLYGELYRSRIVFVFLLSSDPPLLKKSWDNVRFGPAIYQTSALQPDIAVGYIKHRVNTYRVEDCRVPLSPDIYPFDSKDIETSIKTKSIGELGQVQGIVTLRTLNTTLCRALKEGLKATPPSKLPISLAQSYHRMVV